LWIIQPKLSEFVDAGHVPHESYENSVSTCSTTSLTTYTQSIKKKKKTTYTPNRNRPRPPGITNLPHTKTHDYNRFCPFSLHHLTWLPLLFLSLFNVFVIVDDMTSSVPYRKLRTLNAVLYDHIAFKRSLLK
jgi:hypothetical protein